MVQEHLRTCPAAAGDGGRGKTVNTRQNPVVRFLVAAALAVAL